MNLVQPVETHIRVACHTENFDISPTNNSLRFCCNGAPSTIFETNRVHKFSEQNNQQFYQDVIRKSVNNAHAGQSTTILVCGPPSSGRSQTLYGSNDKGIIEYAAEEILKLDGVTATFGGYQCRGSQIVDSTVHKQNVPIHNYSAPMGTTATPHLRHLTSAKKAVLIPQGKQSDGTCVVSFQLYRPIDNNDVRRDVYATLNFVDLAAFNTPCPADVQALSNTLHRLENGGDPEYNRCVLTRLMEPWLVGATTMVGVATITGKQSMVEQTVATLRFLQQLSRLKQVLTLIQMQVPRQLREAILDHEKSVAEEPKILKAAHELGVHDGYNAARQFLSQRCDNDSIFDDVLMDLAIARREQAGHTDQGFRREEAWLEDARQKNKEALNVAKKCTEEHRQLQLQLSRAQNSNQQMEIELSTIQNDCDCYVSECDLKISQLESEQGRRKRRLEEQHQEHKVIRAELRDLSSKTNKALEDIALSQRVAKITRERDELATKRKRLEGLLEQASKNVQSHNERVREDRERKSKLHRLTNAATRVNCLKNNVTARESQIRMTSLQHSSMNGANGSQFSEQSHQSQAPYIPTAASMTPHGDARSHMHHQDPNSESGMNVSNISAGSNTINNCSFSTSTPLKQQSDNEANNATRALEDALRAVEDFGAEVEAEKQQQQDVEANQQAFEHYEDRQTVETPVVAKTTTITTIQQGEEENFISLSESPALPAKPKKGRKAAGTSKSKSNARSRSKTAGDSGATKKTSRSRSAKSKSKSVPLVLDPKTGLSPTLEQVSEDWLPEGLYN